MRQAACSDLIVVLTGAGVSAESGLPTFRGAGGLWEGHRVEEVATPEAFARDPDLIQRFYNLRRFQLRDPAVRPNAAHLALARLEREWPGEVLLVTQNVDDLHERAGSRNLIHLHGELTRALCVACRESAPWTGDLGEDSACPRCATVGRLRPDVVWFGEMPYRMDEIYPALARCGLFVAVGTSGQVYPAAGFVEAVRPGARTVELNLEPSAVGGAFAEHRHGPAGSLVPALVGELLAGARCRRTVTRAAGHNSPARSGSASPSPVDGQARMPLGADAVALTRWLLRENTINPPGGEERAIGILAGLLEEAGFATRRVELAPGRPNLVARLGGGDPDAPALGFTGHLDVVPLGEAPWRHDPFAGETDGDRVYGRGAADMKGGVAAAVVAALAVTRERRRRAGVELVLTAGEETGCAGARRIVETPGSLGRVGALVVAEPTGLVPRLGHRGVIWVRLRFAGRTAHASTPHEGDNAVLKAARAAVLLHGYDFGGVAHPALGAPTLNLGRLEGGLNLNSVPDSAVLGVDIRPVPGQTSAAVLAELRALLPEAELELLVDCPPLWGEAGSDWVAEVAERAARATGERPAPPAPVPFATDAGYLTPAYGGPPTVVLGPGETEQAHKTDEWCSLARIGQAAELYADLARAWCL